MITLGDVCEAAAKSDAPLAMGWNAIVEATNPPSPDAVKAVFFAGAAHAMNIMALAVMSDVGAVDRMRKELLAFYGMDAAAMVPGHVATHEAKVYMYGYAVEEPGGTLMGTAIPKIWRDPQYPPRWIADVAKDRHKTPEEIGHMVGVAVVEVLPEGEA